MKGSYVKALFDAGVEVQYKEFSGLSQVLFSVINLNDMEANQTICSMFKNILRA